MTNGKHDGWFLLLWVLWLMVRVCLWVFAGLFLAEAAWRVLRG